jgi:hypothetical protein
MPEPQRWVTGRLGSGLYVWGVGAARTDSEGITIA